MAKFFSRRSAGQRNTLHPRRFRCGDTGGGVLDDDTLGRFDLQLLRGQQEYLRIGFAARDIGASHARGELVSAAQLLQRQRHILRRARGTDRECESRFGQRVDQFYRTIDRGKVFGDDLTVQRLLAIGRGGNLHIRVLVAKQVGKDVAIRPAKSRLERRLGERLAEFGQHLLPTQEMWLVGVDEHPVDIENHCLLCHSRSSQFNSQEIATPQVGEENEDSATQQYSQAEKHTKRAQNSAEIRADFWQLLFADFVEYKVWQRAKFFHWHKALPGRPQKPCGGSMIRVGSLTQHYSVRPVLSDVSLEILTGELVTVLGPNGMGKSTLLSAMAGILSPQEGYVEFEIDGQMVRRRGSTEGELAIRKRVAFLPDKPWLPGMHTGREFMLAVAELYDIPPTERMEHGERLLRLFNLTEQGDQAISGYSAGQQKKIALCATLITRAPYLLLDEPFSGGLDPAGILALKRVLKRLADDQDVTVVMTTPVPELVEELSTRVAIIADGRLAAFDTVEGLRKQAGIDGGLDEVLQQLIHPDTLENIDNYFSEEAS